MQRIIYKINRVIFFLLVFVSTSVCCLPNCGFANANSIKDFFNNLFGVSIQVEQPLTSVYLGGIPLGFTLNCNGAMVIAVGQVHSAGGVMNTIISGNIEAGDIITHIDNQQITSVEIIEKQMEKQQKNNTKVRLRVIGADGQNKTVDILPAKDIITEKYKLGLWVRDNSAGVGTLTYVRTDNMRFGALGHSVCDIDTGRQLPLLNGDVYKCNIIGVQASKKGSAGELKGLFLRGGTHIGTVDKNTTYGVFGTASKQLVDLLSTTIPVANKDKVKTGRASIYCCIGGGQPKEYAIEIIKASRYLDGDNKSMVIRIVDQQLIDETGGIVQGMSGSPIVQNGMLVGAVTHVFVSDPTKGYGIFAQTMIDNGN